MLSKVKELKKSTVIMYAFAISITSSLLSFPVGASLLALPFDILGTLGRNGFISVGILASLIVGSYMVFSVAWTFKKYVSFYIANNYNVGVDSARQ